MKNYAAKRMLMPPKSYEIFYFLTDFIIMGMFTSFTQKPIPFVEENALHKLTSTDALGSFSNFFVFRKSFIKCLYSIEAKERNNSDFKQLTHAFLFFSFERLDHSDIRHSSMDPT